MSKEIIILIAAWIITIILLILYVPRNRLREAHVIFFFKQLITWLIGLIVAEFRLIEYPVELFRYATRSSFSFEYFIYPAICIIFNLQFPKTINRWIRFLYYVAYCSVMTLIEVLIVEYTDIANYLHWTWYLTWITLFITFYLSRKYYLWFFKKKEPAL